MINLNEETFYEGGPAKSDLIINLTSYPDDIASSATRKPVFPEAPVMANFIGFNLL